MPTIDEAGWTRRHAHEMGRPLTDRDREILTVAFAGYHIAGGRENDIVLKLRMKVTTFWQIVNDLIDDPRVIREYPTHANRLRRLRENRRFR